ncbi:18893_t:CDS:1, partial [Gigaspora rosea]
FSIGSSEYTSDILVDNSKIGNVAFRTLSAILKALILVWKIRKIL